MANPVNCCNDSTSGIVMLLNTRLHLSTVGDTPRESRISMAVDRSVNVIGSDAVNNDGNVATVTATVFSISCASLADAGIMYFWYISIGSYEPPRV